jgi:hypothetical protein
MRATISALAVLAALAAPLAASAHPSETCARSGPYSLQLVDESGRILPTFSHGGRMYALGALGQRYMLRVRNGSGRRIEVVASVDGLDVVDGRAAAFGKRGYLVEAHGEVTIDGYRLSQGAVAAFRFSSVPRSYAARKGDARDVGVIGVAIFPERPRWRPPYPVPYSRAPEASARSEERSAAPAGSATGSEAAPAPAGEPSAPSAAPEAKAFADARRAERPGLGTEFGEEHESRVQEVEFERASSTPEAMMTIRYDDRQGLLAAGVDVDGTRFARDEVRRRAEADPFRGERYAEPPPGWQGR